MKHMDIIAPLGWNWNNDDWRIYNFMRDLESCGGVVRGQYEDTFVLINYDKLRPSRSTWIREVVAK